MSNTIRQEDGDNNSKTNDIRFPSISGSKTLKKSKIAKTNGQSPSDVTLKGQSSARPVNSIVNQVNFFFSFYNYKSTFCQLSMC